MSVRILLISNSVQHGSGYLDHCAGAIGELLGSGVRTVLFVPFALHDHDAYTQKVRERFQRMGYGVDGLHESDEPAQAVEAAAAIFIGGGNTFRLLDALYRLELLEPIRQRIRGGMPYLGTSAGSNVACPTIMTTNDMPIVEPPSFAALGLVSFQINPHYLDPDPSSTHQGETRELRIREFLEENDRVVVGLREGSMVRVEGRQARLEGNTGARLFQRDSEPRELAPGASLTAFT